MKKYIPITLILISILMLNNLHGQNLKQHKWKNRILVVVTKDQQLPIFQQQLAEFSHSFEALAERKLVLYILHEATYQFTDFQKKDNTKAWKTSKALDEKFGNTDEAFEVFLIGLDGRVKLQETEVLSQWRLFTIIDAMPMRILELEGREE